MKLKEETICGVTWVIDEARNNRVPLRNGRTREDAEWELATQESCSGLVDCSRLTDCLRLVACSGLTDCSDKRGDLVIPTIAGIHGKVYAAASQPDALNMSYWHSCDTAHCRAGWVVVLAGEAGRELERKTSTPFAAMQIYKASDPANRVSPTRFFDSASVAMDDMKRLAEIEAASAAKGGA